MTDARLDAVYLGTLIKGDPNARLDAVHIQALVNGTPSARVDMTMLSILVPTASPWAYKGTQTGITISSPVGSYSTGLGATPQSFDGSLATIVITSPSGSYDALIGTEAQSYTGAVSEIIASSPVGSYLAELGTDDQSFEQEFAAQILFNSPAGDYVNSIPVPQDFDGLSAQIIFNSPLGHFHYFVEYVSADSSVEFTGGAEDPADAEKIIGNSSVEFSSSSETPIGVERLRAGSSVVFSGHAVNGLRIVLDPPTLRPVYSLKLVNSFGEPTLELTEAEMDGDAVQVLKGRGGFSFRLPKDHPHTAMVHQYDQVQIWIEDQMVPNAWFYIVDPIKDSGSAFQYGCSGLRWLFENVRIGKERPELLKNGGFEDGIKYWHPTWFAGSASEAPPDITIVTGADALDGGKALQTTAVESVTVNERKTDAIFLGNRPYAWEPLANGFISGGEQVIRDMVQGIAQNAHITVECYTADVDGGTGQALSERRAAASKDVIEAYRSDLVVTAIGRGETVQVAPNNTPANQAKNRRIVITYSSTKVGHRQAVTQRFYYTQPSSKRLPEEIELDGWINLIEYVGPSKDRYGFYIDRRKASEPNKIIDFQTTDLPPEFPHETWVPDGTMIKCPADSIQYLFEVRLYGAAGDSKFDEITCKPNVFTAFFNVDKPTAIKSLIEHGQDPTYGKVDLNVETRCPAWGPKDDYKYYWKDHRTVDDCISELISADDAPDFGIVATPTQRIATTWGRRGRYVAEMFELGGLIAQYTSAVRGDMVTGTAIVTSSRDGGGDAEVFVRSGLVNGLALERLQSAEPNRQVSRLTQVGKAMTRYGRTDVITSITFDPKWTIWLLEHTGLGDVIPLSVSDLDADGNYRIVEISHSIKRHELTYQLAPEF